MSETITINDASENQLFEFLIHFDMRINGEMLSVGTITLADISGHDHMFILTQVNAAKLDFPQLYFAQDNKESPKEIRMDSIAFWDLAERLNLSIKVRHAYRRAFTHCQTLSKSFEINPLHTCGRCCQSTHASRNIVACSLKKQFFPVNHQASCFSAIVAEKEKHHA